MTRRVWEYTAGGTVQVEGPPVSPSEKKRKAAELKQMLVDRTPPGIETDSTYFARNTGRFDQLANRDREYRIEQAKKHGYTPSDGDRYEPTLARFPGDPKAFISRTGGRAQMKKATEDLYREPLKRKALR